MEEEKGESWCNYGWYCVFQDFLFFFFLPALQRAISIGFSVFSFQSGPWVHNRHAPTPEKSDSF